MILADLNILLDVLQKREPHYLASAAVLGQAVEGRVTCMLPAHAFTTIHDIIVRHQSRAKANQVVDWLLRHFDVRLPVAGSLSGRVS